MSDTIDVSKLTADALATIQGEDEQSTSLNSQLASAELERPTPVKI